MTPLDYLKAKFSVEIMPYDLKVLIETKADSVVLIDVRDAAAFEAEHVAGSRNIPLHELTAKMAILPKDKQLVVYCGDPLCGLALRAALALLEKGFRVRYMPGSLAQWASKGLRIERKGAVPQELFPNPRS